MRIGIVVGVLLVMAAAVIAQPPDWASVRSFTYQLQTIDLRAIAATKFELAVIDYSSDGSEESRFSAEQIAAVQKTGKRILAYMSIGEAEDYRFYWQKDWAHKPPAWLDRVNPEWKGNYKVRYWDPAWQAIVMAYLDKIIDAGFDGVYLDCVDSFEYWGPDGEGKLNRESAPREMADFVMAIARHARVERGKPGFAVFPQNGEALGQFADYVAAVNGIGREDVFYNGNKPNKASETAEVVKNLEVFERAGKLVLIIDYVRKKPLIDAFYTRCEERGFVPYATVRPLDALVINPGHEPR